MRQLQVLFGLAVLAIAAALAFVAIVGTLEKSFIIAAVFGGCAVAVGMIGKRCLQGTGAEPGGVELQHVSRGNTHKLQTLLGLAALAIGAALAFVAIIGVLEKSFIITAVFGGCAMAVGMAGKRWVRGNG